MEIGCGAALQSRRCRLVQHHLSAHLRWSQHAAYRLTSPTDLPDADVEKTSGHSIALMMNGVAAPPAKVPGAPRFLVIGAGSRGCAYARAVTTATAGVVAAVAEPDDFKRKHFGTRYIWGPDNEPREGQAFKSWQVWLEWETSRRKIACSVRAGPHMVSSVQGVFIVYSQLPRIPEHGSDILSALSMRPTLQSLLPSHRLTSISSARNRLQRV